MAVSRQAKWLVYQRLQRSPCRALQSSSIAARTSATSFSPKCTTRTCSPRGSQIAGDACPNTATARACRSGQMRNTGVVAQKQCATLQHRRQFDQFQPTRQRELAVFQQRRQLRDRTLVRLALHYEQLRRQLVNHPARQRRKLLHRPVLLLAAAAGMHRDQSARARPS